MKQAMDNSNEVKIAVLGEAGVGKSALVVRLMTGRFLHRYDPTLEDEYRKAIDLDGEQYQLCIFDTAGQVCIHLWACNCIVLNTVQLMTLFKAVAS